MHRLHVCPGVNSHCKLARLESMGWNFLSMVATRNTSQLPFAPEMVIARYGLVRFSATRSLEISITG
jgi:hypothetical protein